MKAQQHSETSTSAAIAIEPKAGTLRANVLAYLRRRGVEGATDQEIQESLNLDPSTERPRRVELVDAGLVRDGLKKRATKSGRAAVVWVAVDEKRQGELF